MSTRIPRFLTTIFYLSGSWASQNASMTTQSSQSMPFTTLPNGSYYLGSRTQVRIRNDPRTAGHRALTSKPVVLLSLDEASTEESILRVIESFRSDDVFSDDFLTDTVVVQTASLNKKLRIRCGKWSPDHVIEIENSHALPDGPYFLTADNLLAQAWRLYPDTQDAFSTTFVPNQIDPLRFEPLGGMVGDGLWRQVAVPSRLYARVTAVKPLAGLRVSIKDNFKVAGIKTTLSNRAFVETYGPESETAKFLERLINLGAIVVGKTKICAFASSEEATDQWIDFHAPFNPRADGYQSPSGSTTGGAASLASYDWLDYSIGTDTTGSIRWPAAWNGLFGLRTTWGIDALEGVYPTCRAMDTLGLLSRDLHGLQNLMIHSLPASKCDGQSFPKSILYCTDFFPHAIEAQQAHVEEFVSLLESFLGVERTEVSIAERWKQCPPDEAEGKDIRTYINKTAYYPFYYDGYNEFSQFRDDYLKKYGKPVYVGPYMRWKWDRGAEVMHEHKTQALRELEVYRSWFHDNIMKPEPNGGSEAILIMPCGSGEPKYRDLPNGAPSVVPPFSPNYVASMLGLPQLVVPVGQLPFESRISKRTEYLPIVASIVGAPGSDLMLTNLARLALESAHRPTVVQTGRFTFPIQHDSASM